MHTRELNSQAFGVKNITEPPKPLNQTDILSKGFLIVLNLKIFIPDMTSEPSQTKTNIPIATLLTSKSGQ